MFELIQMAQYRISFYGIFSLSDDVRMGTLKVKKIRDQLRVVKEDLECYKDELKAAKQEITQLRIKLLKYEPDHTLEQKQFETPEISIKKEPAYDDSKTMGYGNYDITPVVTEQDIFSIKAKIMKDMHKGKFQ